MKQKIIYFLSIFLFISFLFYFFQKNPELVSTIKTIPIKIIIILLTLTTILLAINGYFLKIITEPFGITIKNYFWLSAVTSLLNLITPFRGGAIFRGWYLKKKYNLALKDIFVTIAGSYPIIFFINSFLGLLLLTYETYLGKTIPFWGWIFFGGIFIGTISLFFLPKINSPYFKKINLLISGWHKITKNKKTIFLCTLQQFIFSITSATIIYFIFQSINYEITFLESLLISVFTIFAVVINITPAGIGITEAFLVMSGLLIGISIETMLFVSIIQRGITLLTFLPLGFIGKFILLKKLNTSFS